MGNKPRRYGLAIVIGAVVVVTAAVGVIAFDLVRAREANISAAKAWDIKGAPCPAFTFV